MKKKILFVINTLGQAGAERALITLLSYIDKNQYDVYLYVMLNQGELVDEVPGYVQILNHHISPKSLHGKAGERELVKEVLTCGLRHGSGLRQIGSIVRNYKRMKQQDRVQLDKLLWRTVADGGKRFPMEFDLAIAYLEGASTYYVADYVLAKKKVAWVHVDVNEAGYTRELDGDSYDKIDHIYGVSHEVKDAFLTLHPECKEKTSVIENIISVEDIQKKSKEEYSSEFDKNSFCLLTVGRLHQQKAYDVAIDAMKLVKEKRGDIKWYVVGDGPLKEELQKKIKDEDLENEFILLGHRKNPYPCYADCDIYIQATRFEGKSISIREAKALGCPLIVSNVSGNREQIEDGKNGLLCELTKESIAEKILYLSDNEALRQQMSEMNRNEKDDHHLEELKKLFEDI